MRKIYLMALLVLAALWFVGQDGPCFSSGPDLDAIIMDPARPGDSILVLGDDLTSSGELLYDGEALVITSWSNDEIEAILPDPKPDGTYDVQVITEDDEATNTLDHTIWAEAGCTPPPYNPEKWNVSGVQSNNNCYNFGNDEITNTFAQPGRACGDQYGAITCNEVHEAALCDGLLDSTAEATCPDDMHKVYLVVGPGWDYHWYRENTDDMWAHKPGGTAATNRDNSGDLIDNPETADTGSYTDHCGYLCACGDYAYIR